MHGQSLAAMALGRVGLESDDVVVPALIDSLNDDKWSVRNYAASSLGKFGSKAKRAIPALKRAIQQEEHIEYSSALSTLETLDPEAARKIKSKRRVEPE